MRTATVFTLGVLLAAGAASAQPISQRPPRTTLQCIESGGQSIPPVCQVPGSRLDKGEYICTCPNGGLRTDVAICAKGQKPPPEGLALDKARAAGLKDGSLIGDKLGDRPICVAPRGS
jgi:hypothetical protein